MDGLKLGRAIPICTEDSEDEGMWEWSAIPICTEDSEDEGMWEWSGDAWTATEQHAVSEGRVSRHQRRD